eukprot:jgi/Mesvir1/25636/Mv01854-RA.1
MAAATAPLSARLESTSPFVEDNGAGTNNDLDAIANEFGLSVDELQAAKDSQLAFELMQEIMVMQRDALFCQMLSGMNFEDQCEAANLQLSFQESYERERADMQVAQRMAGNRTLAETAEIPEAFENACEAAKRLLDEKPKPAEDDTKRGTSASHGRKQEIEGGDGVACAACNVTVSSKKSVSLVCFHTYCTPCLAKVFTAAVTDISLLPVRCCRTPIDPAFADFLLRGATLDTFKKRWMEFSCQRKMYCQSRPCGKFIDLTKQPLLSNGHLECPSCNTALCGKCKSLWHAKLTCEQYQALPEHERSPDDRAVLQLAESQQWKRCPQCSVIIQLTVGCNHMVCNCGKHFCYNCRDSWDQKANRCVRGCNVWDEDRLVARAEHQLGPQLQQMPAEMRQGAIRGHMARIREAHACEHRWKGASVRYGETCSECNWEPPVFIKLCHLCGDRRCRRCALQGWW